MKQINSIHVHPSIRNLLSFATADFRVDQVYDTYLKSPKRKLVGLELSGRFVGCIGIEIMNPDECVIKHIAVSKEHRKKGIGSKMVDYLSEQFQIITAETDNDAVDFYRKYGFTITGLGEKYPGVERFLCAYSKE